MTNLIKHIFTLVFLFLYGGSMFSQTSSSLNAHENYTVSDKHLSFQERLWEFSQWFDDHHIFNNVDFAFTLGTSGLGLEIGTPITKWTKIRAGITWIPSFRVPMEFDINTFSEGLPSNNFQHVQELLYNLTGMEIDEKVKMTGEPYLLNFKLLIDVFPFKNNRHWHFTAGFFVGNTTIAKAYNHTEEKPTLVGLNIYNRAYNYFTNIKDIYDVPLGGGNYLDPAKVKELQEKFGKYGHMGMHVGDFKDGTPYIMEPAPDGSLSAKAYVKKFKPYLGFGYSGNLDKSGKLKIGFEAGALFWGGVPNVIDQNGVNMTKDLINVKGKVGDYLALIKALPVFPILELKISYSLY